jgi:P4 family phage/plasmid primase-like protien
MKIPNNFDDINEWADFWRDEIGVNVIPAVSRGKIPVVKWKEFQDKPIPRETHDQWKNQGLFDNGMAIILGRVWHRADRLDYYLVCIDADNALAIQELFTRNGKHLPIEQFANRTIVELHKDNPNRLHFYVYTVGKQLRNKSSDVGHLDPGVDPDSVPCFEVKASSGLLSFPCPGIHKDGFPIEIIGTLEPVVLSNTATIDDMQNHIDSVCRKYGLFSGSDGNKIPISELFKDDAVIYEGHNRHEALLRVIESLIKRTAGVLPLDQIKQFSGDWNNKHCNPPLDDREFNKQWKSATDFMAKNNSVSESEGSGSSSKKNRGFSENLNESDVDYEDRLIAEYHLKTLSDTQEIYYYNNSNGIFVPNGESILMMRIESDLGRDDPNDPESTRLSNHDFNERIGHIKRRTQTSRASLNPNIEWLATTDCMINLKTEETQPFNPKFMCTTQIPVYYNQGYPTGKFADFFRLVEGDTSKITKFLNDIMSPRDVNQFLDFLAYCLWRDYPHNYWMLLHGAGFNGKSILLNLIERFLGKDNASGETLDRLLHRDFSIANLFGKMVNVDADVSADMILDNTGIIKKLTGNDLHPGEFKHKTPFKFRNYAKLIFSCNRIPKNTDDTTAFFRRLIIINFTQQFLGEKEDPHIIDKISTQEELTALLHKLIPRLRRILRDGFKKLTDEVLTENYDKYTLGSDPVKYFCEKALELDPQSRVPKLEMYEHYDRFCKAKGLTIESSTLLSMKLTRDMRLESGKTRVQGESVRYWRGVRLVGWEEREREEQDTIGDYSSFDEAVRAAP